MPKYTKAKYGKKGTSFLVDTKIEKSMWANEYKPKKRKKK